MGARAAPYASASKLDGSSENLDRADSVERVRMRGIASLVLAVKSLVVLAA